MLLHYISFYGLLHISLKWSKEMEIYFNMRRRNFLVFLETHTQQGLFWDHFVPSSARAHCLPGFSLALGIKKGFFSAAVSVFLNFLQSAYVFSTVFSHTKEETNKWTWRIIIQNCKKKKVDRKKIFAFAFSVTKCKEKMSCIMETKVAILARIEKLFGFSILQICMHFSVCQGSLFQYLQ